MDVFTHIRCVSFRTTDTGDSIQRAVVCNLTYLWSFSNNFLRNTGNVTQDGRFSGALRNQKTVGNTRNVLGIFLTFCGQGVVFNWKKKNLVLFLALLYTVSWAVGNDM